MLLTFCCPNLPGLGSASRYGSCPSSAKQCWRKACRDLSCIIPWALSVTWQLLLSIPSWFLHLSSYVMELDCSPCPQILCFQHTTEALCREAAKEKVLCTYLTNNLLKLGVCVFPTNCNYPMQGLVTQLPFIH